MSSYIPLFMRFPIFSHLFSYWESGESEKESSYKFLLVFPSFPRFPFVQKSGKI